MFDKVFKNDFKKGFLKIHDSLVIVLFIVFKNKIK